MQWEAETLQNELPATILSALQVFNTPDALPSHSLHPFSSAPSHGSLEAVRGILELTNQVSQSLNSNAILPLSNSKLLSLYRQLASISHTVHSSDSSVRHAISTLRQRAGITYGEDIPLDRTVIVDWCVLRLKAWGAAAGMEAFREEEREGRMTVVLGGKVLVIDIDLSVDRSDPGRPRVDVAGVKTNYAVQNSASGTTTAGSLSLDGFLAEWLQSFLFEVQKDSEAQDSIEAARLGTLFAEHLSYLMRLDQLAQSEGNDGLRWFKDVDALSLDAERFAVVEADVVAQSLSSVSCPLDIFLARAHALPLPYLTTPSVSFLVSVSPLAYLSILRAPHTAPAIAPKATLVLPDLDIPFLHLRRELGEHARPYGVTIASLVLSSKKSIMPTPEPMFTDLDLRPTFLLAPSGAEINHVFPQVTDPQSPATSSLGWILDFTEGGKYPGVVMTQARMREIELIINPLKNLDDLANMPMMAYGGSSWLSLLLSPGSPVPIEYYTALYTSPTFMHPPLQLRLAAPEEPGFLLETVPVRTLKQVWGVLEIVKEQCWLNDAINSCSWLPEDVAVEDIATGDAEVTEDELQAVLLGAVTPRKLPVNVYIPSSPASDSLFDSDGFNSMVPHFNSTRVVMTSPERSPVTGLVQISVAFDRGRPRGVSVGIQGALGAELRIETLEEVCRRGSVFSLPGRVWVHTQGVA